MIVWIAREAYDYEGSHILGVYDSEVKAVQSCEDVWRERGKHPLKWKKGEAIGANKDHSYKVGRYEVE